ncbi:hypothetical protein [Acinetobacter soli]|uniref:hypothetical protein n=1 Tax=Acinetobacter soli TaxID=487316 RepID=UPI00208FD2B6|nr:hypothetical protein [Acinetobacter soli]
MKILLILFSCILIPFFIIIIFKFSERVWLEIPEKTIRVVGKILSENKNSFEHEIVVTLYQEELLILVGEKSEENFKVFKSAVLWLETESNKIVVYIDTLKVGYLNKINAFQYSKFLMTKNFMPDDAFEVDAVIIGSMIDPILNISTWLVKLDIPNDMQKFRFDQY